MDSSQPEPSGGAGHQGGFKRSQSDGETETDTKRQRLDEEQSLDIVDIDPDGDLMIKCDSKTTTYRVDSNTLRRTIPVLYKKCMAVRPADGSSSWIFHGLRNFSGVSTKAILDCIHGNECEVPTSMHIRHVENAVAFAIEYGILESYSETLSRWFRTMAQLESNSGREKTRNCYRLWLACQFHLDGEYKDIQTWAIFNLCDNGEGALGDSHERFNGHPLSLQAIPHSDKIITGKFITSPETVEF